MNKADILSRGRRAAEPVQIAALGGDTVLFKRLSARQAEAYYESVQEKNEKGEPVFVSKGSRAKLIAVTVVDEAGEPLLTVEDVDALDNEVVTELFKEAQRVNGLNKDSLDEAKKD